MSAPQTREAPGCVLMTADTIGGVWTYALDLSHGLCERGSKVVLATMGQSLSPLQRSQAARIDGLQVVESNFKLEWMDAPWGDIDAAGQWLLELEQRFSPDLVHLNGYAHGALPFRAPVMIVAHSCVLSWWRAVKGEDAPVEWETYKQRVQAGLKAARSVVAPTHAMLAAVHQHYGPLPPSRAIYNGRNFESMCAEGEKHPIIFAAGRLGDEAKNIRTLGEAARDLDWGVFVAGAECDASGRASLPANVNHCGKLVPSEVARWMASASIYCLPARYEPFGLSILEAALAGCALVLGDIPSLRELWSGAARFVPPNDAEQLHAALRELIADSAARQQLATAARERAKRYSYESFIEGYLCAYGELRSAKSPDQLAAA